MKTCAPLYRWTVTPVPAKGMCTQTSSSHTGKRCVPAVEGGHARRMAKTLVDKIAQAVEVQFATGLRCTVKPIIVHLCQLHIFTRSIEAI